MNAVNVTQNAHPPPVPNPLERAGTSIGGLLASMALDPAESRTFGNEQANKEMF
jgi:hypothetical protein